ncbi:hypothetical protein KAU11_12005 [Candidatus Babeliales bacterium]|nr:hypothetical protein [Candidatus Babeliales bacterium]
MENQTIPKIKKVADVGETPFNFIEKTESILQGWDKQIKKTIYLFRTDTGAWGYYDPDSGQVIEVHQWKSKAAWVNGYWVKMAIYHRLKLLFSTPITWSGWDKANNKAVKETASEVIVTVTDTAYKTLIEQLEGRPAESLFKFVFTTRKLGGRNVTYINKVVWVNTATT